MASVAKREWTTGGEQKTAWVVRYKDQDGKRRLKTFEQKKLADKYRFKVETEIEKGEHIPDADVITVKTLCDLYIKYGEQRVEDKRLTKGSLVVMRNHVRGIEKRLGTLKVTALNPLAIDAFYRESCRDDNLLPITAKTRVKWLRTIEEFAIKRGYIRRKSAAADALIELRGVERAPIRTFTLEEMQMLLQTLKKKRWRGEVRSHDFVNCLVHIAVFCGLRAGEIMGLKREHVDFDKGVIRVRHSFSWVDGLKAPKTKAGVRDVPMPSIVAGLLYDWLEQHFIENEDGLVFRTATGHRFKWGSVHYNMWKPLLRRAGLSDEFHFHALRHFAASLMVSHNMPVTDVAQLLGHSKVDMTLAVYAHPLIGVQRQSEAIERMARQLVETPVTMDATSTRHEGLSL